MIKTKTWVLNLFIFLVFFIGFTILNQSTTAMENDKDNDQEKFLSVHKVKIEYLCEKNETPWESFISRLSKKEELYHLQEYGIFSNSEKTKNTSLYYYLEELNEQHKDHFKPNEFHTVCSEQFYSNHLNKNNWEKEKYCSWNRWRWNVTNPKEKCTECVSILEELLKSNIIQNNYFYNFEKDIDNLRILVKGESLFSPVTNFFWGVQEFFSESWINTQISWNDIQKRSREMENLRIQNSFHQSYPLYQPKTYKYATRHGTIESPYPIQDHDPILFDPELCGYKVTPYPPKNYYYTTSDHATKKKKELPDPKKTPIKKTSPKKGITKKITVPKKITKK